MAVPVAVLEEMGGFASELGRVGSLLLSGEEVLLQKQLLCRGYRCWYIPHMAVKHRVPAARLTKRWFVRRHYCQGLSDAAMQMIEEPPTTARRVSLALEMCWDLLRSPEKLTALLLPQKDPQRFAEKCWTLIKVGHIVGLLGATRSNVQVDLTRPTRSAVRDSTSP